MPILFNSPWPGLTVWLVLYASDYALTLVCARLYRSGVSEKVAIEGSFELNPFFQKDIDSLKRISPRFLAMFFITGLFLCWVWFLSKQSTREFYEFLLGYMVLLELAVHMRHVRNFFTFRLFEKPDYVRGRIEYSRVFILRMSSVEMFAFSGLFLMLSAFTQSWFVLGGAASCSLTALANLKSMRKLLSKTSVAIVDNPGSSSASAGTS